MSSPTTVTIITSTLNCASALKSTANSIREQTGGSVQWIIADGGSTDGFLDVIRESADLVDHWFSEPDEGIYDAWNNACSFIRGEWVLFLGAGDVLASPNTLHHVVAELARVPSAVLIVYGNVIQEVAGKERYRWGWIDLDTWTMYRPMLPAHQGVFHRSKLLRRPKPFDSSYKVVADSKLLLSIISHETTRYMDIDVSKMEPGGISSNPRSTLKVMREFLRLEADLGYRIPRGRRLLFVTRSYAKFILYRIAGPATVNCAVRLKQRFVRLWT